MWEVVGYQISANDKGDITGYTIFIAKEFKGNAGVGLQTKRVWFRPIIGYVPALGDKVMVDVEKRGSYDVVTDIVKF